MTVQSPPAYLQNGSHSAALFRQAIASAWQEGGPVQPSELWVAAQATPNMSVQVGAGRAVIQGSQVSAPGLLPSGTGIFTSQAMYVALNDAAVTVTISASDPTNPRIDVVYIAVQDSFYSGSTNQALVGVVTGTPAASPVAPAAPANAEVLATVSVAANATSVTNANIANKISPAAPIGQPVTVDTYAHLLLWTPLVAGTYADVDADSTSSNNGLYRWNGSVWIPATAGAAFTYSKTSAFNFTTTTTALPWDSLTDGALAGFTTNLTTFTCTVPGTYRISAKAAMSAGTALCNVQIQKNGTTVEWAWATATANFQTILVTAERRFAVGDTLAIAIAAAATTAGVSGTAGANTLSVSWVRG